MRRLSLIASVAGALCSCSPKTEVVDPSAGQHAPGVSRTESKHAFDRNGVAQAKTFRWLRTGTWKPIPTFSHGVRGVALVTQDQIGGRVMTLHDGGYAIYQAQIDCSATPPLLMMKEGRHFSFGGGTARSRALKNAGFIVSPSDVATACRSPRKAGAQTDADSVARTLRASGVGTGMDPARAERLKQAQANDPRSKGR